MLLIVLMTCSLWGTTAAAEKIVMVSHFSPDKLVLGKWTQLIYTEAFQRLGFEMEYAVYPYKRGDYLVEQGKADGALVRPYDYAKAHPDLVRVEEPAPVDRLGAFAKDADIQLEGWESLKGRTYKINYPRGFVLAEMSLPKVAEAENIGAVDEWGQGLKKLAAGRIDIFLAPESIMIQLLNTEEFKDSGITMAGVMQDVTLYAFLRPEHRALAPKLAEVLKQMKAEELIEQYRQGAEDALQ